ncbi:MAG: ATP-binding protein [Methanomicrobiales archaeon]|nr:ATP-binding protein [Methanomicrobiales archaeon]
MKYKDIVQFDSIEGTIQLRDADELAGAERLVKTFVISQGMAEKLVGQIIPQLSLTTTIDRKGLFIVGNYGTGKSHMMSVLTSVLEYPNIYKYIANEKVRNEIEPLSGKYKVIRTEIGAVKRPIRDIFCSVLETELEKIGVNYKFPAADETKKANNKDDLIAMMGAFQVKYPDTGLIFAIDEMLEYLRQRPELDLIYDLIFLRELGESCKYSHFRFLAGIQESLFESPRFQFAADTLRRVKDRYEQIRIMKEDISYVVSERLLKKDDKQKAIVREHLSQYSSLYSQMAERMEEFVSLYPIHPSYIETLELLFIVENRHILQSISKDLTALMEEKVPQDAPGLISFDRYWKVMKQDVSLLSDPNIHKVIDKGTVLENLISRSFPKPQYKEAALRIIHGLLVARLQTIDIYKPTGLTSEQIKDELCIFLKSIPEKESQFLLTTVESIIKDIVTTVSGKFISKNEENKQYYIDLEKSVDIDLLIEEKGAGLNDDQLDKYYFESLTRLMDRPDTTYVSGYRIWEHELIWKDRNVGRMGYLFFGAPNERSTAQPPRDFYLYFIQPFNPPVFNDEHKPDEIFFRLIKKDDAFIDALRKYGGAREMSAITNVKDRQDYDRKAQGYLKDIVQWLSANMGHSLEVTYQSQTKKLVEWSKESTIPLGPEVHRAINEIASYCVSPHFNDISPDYPKFSVTITSTNRHDMVIDALSWIKGRTTKSGSQVLAGLELMTEGVLTPEKSRYSQYILTTLSEKQGQVINRQDLIGLLNGVEYDKKFRIEPELFMVVLSALVWRGSIVISYVHGKIDASNVDTMAKMAGDDLIAFKHLEPPKTTPIELLEYLFTTIGLRPGEISNPATQESAVESLQRKVEQEAKNIAVALDQLNKRVTILSEPLPSDEVMSSLIIELKQGKELLESLRRFNSVGKLKNFNLSRDDVDLIKKCITSLQIISEYSRLINELNPITSYIQQVSIILPTLEGEEIRKEIDNARSKIRCWTTPPSSEEIRTMKTDLEKVKTQYANRYFTLHNRARLGVSEDVEKKKLLNDPRLKALQQLANTGMNNPLLPVFTNKLTHTFKTCFNLTQDDLLSSPICPHCHFKPSEEQILGSVREEIYELDDELDGMYKEITHRLIEDLSDPMVQETLSLMNKEHRDTVELFINEGVLPDPISIEFVQSVKEAIAGLTRVVIFEEDLIKSLSGSGAPIPKEEFDKRFVQFMKDKTNGLDLKKIRVVLEKKSP